MKQYETMLDKMYRCKIEPTGETLTRITEFELPMNPNQSIKYTHEQEVAIKFPETDLKNFLRDYEHWCEILSACREHPHIQTEYQQLLLLARLIN